MSLSQPAIRFRSLKRSLFSRHRTFRPTRNILYIFRSRNALFFNSSFLCVCARFFVTLIRLSDFCEGTNNSYVTNFCKRVIFQWRCEILGKFRSAKMRRMLWKIVGFKYSVFYDVITVFLETRKLGAFHFQHCAAFFSVSLMKIFNL